MVRIFLSIVMIFAMLLPAAAQQKAVPQSKAEITLSYAPLVKRTAPAVVNVFTKTVVQQREPAIFSDPFFRRFFGDKVGVGRSRERVENSLGSGVIVSADGFIVTNNHVIKNATDIRVVLADRREFEAKLLLADERTDLAILKIDAGDEDLPALEFSDSDELEVGDLVLAIGNPFGVGQTVTSGIVSALARTRVGVTDYQFFIQTDAAINPGNSGGALINMRGEVVGINTAIYSRSGGSIGIGFSIPSNMVQTVVQSAQSGDVKIKRPWLGVELQDVTADIAENLGFARPEGALITKLHPASPLVAAGMKRGDVIVGFDGRAIDNAQEFGFKVGTAKIGERKFVEYRRGDLDRETQVAMIAAPENTERDETLIKGNTPLAGMLVANLSPSVAEEVGLSADEVGVAVLDVGRGAARQFFKKGDIILEINGTKIADVATLSEVVRETEGRWSMVINRSGKKLALRVR